MAFATTTNTTNAIHVIWLPDGNYIGLSNIVQDNQSNLVAQKFGLDGSTLGPVVTLDTGKPYSVSSQFVSTLDANGVLTLFALQGALYHYVWDIATPTISSSQQLTSYPVVTSSKYLHEANGNFSLTDVNYSFGTQLLNFDSSGTQVSSALILRPQVPGVWFDWHIWSVSSNLMIASQDNGHTLRFYKDLLSSPTSFTEVSFITSANAGPFGELIHTRSLQDVTLLSNGNLLVTWSVSGGFVGTQVFSPEGVALGELVSLSSGTNAMVERIADGELLLLWMRGDYLMCKSFNESGEPTSQNITLMKFSGWNSLTRPIELNGSVLNVTWGPFLFAIDLTKAAGSAGNDSLATLSFTTSMEGFAGNDILTGADRTETLMGGDGNDWLEGNGGGDLLNGGNGIDTASYFTLGSVSVALDGSFAQAGAASGDQLVSVENLVGSREGDTLTGNALSNRIVGHGGNDTLSGQDGNDVLLGGAGFDTLNGGNGIDTLSYEQEDAVAIALDFSIGRRGAAVGDTFSSIENLTGSNTGGDNLVGNARANVVSGLGGNDTVAGRAGNDKLYGGAGNDLLRGGAGADLQDGGKGFDLVSYFEDAGVQASLDKSLAGTGAARGDTYVSIEDLSGSNTGNDTLAGNGVRNYLYGNGGNDSLLGRGGSDVLEGGEGADKLDGGVGFDWADYFDAGPVNVALDRSFSFSGAARGDTFVSIENIAGSDSGNDRIAGDANDNYLFGRGGNDTLNGGSGNDTLDGDAGWDKLKGGNGYDAFYYDEFSQGNDTITDFTKDDIFLIEFKTIQKYARYIGGGGISDNYFRVRADNKAVDRNDHFIFRKTDDSLWFDPDGSGAKAAMMLARLSNGYDLMASDIFISI